MKSEWELQTRPEKSREIGYKGSHPAYITAQGPINRSTSDDGDNHQVAASLKLYVAILHG
jgi:hypothetical protein